MENVKKMALDKKNSEKRTTEDPELAIRFNKVLQDTVEAMEAAGIKYMFIGGIASGGLGRPRSTHDIDLFVRPEDAEITLRALAAQGFQTAKTDPTWLYKAFKDNILVDVIFKSKGEIYLDTEMYQKMTTAEFHGKKLRLVAPEDLVIIKAAAHSEVTPGHWHDAIALLSYANIDWKYLIKRARRAPRRVMSLLLYAQSNDIWVPNYVIHELYSGIFENANVIGAGEAGKKNIPVPLVHRKELSSTSPPSLSQEKVTQVYAAAHLRQILAEDSRTNELDIQIEQDERRLLLRGEVAFDDRRQAVVAIAREKFPDFQIENQIRVTDFKEPTEEEEVK